MRSRPLLLVMLLLATIGVANWHEAPPAAACSCALLTPAEHAENADLVAEGIVVGVDRPESPSSSTDDATYTVEVTRVWKGPDVVHVAVLSAVDGASCGLEGIEQGMTLALFANEEADSWRSISCDGTAPMDEAIAADLTAAMGEPRSPTPAVQPAPTVDEEGDSPTVLTWGLAIALTALLAAVAFTLARRRNA